MSKWSSLGWSLFEGFFCLIKNLFSFCLNFVEKIFTWQMSNIRWDFDFDDSVMHFSFDKDLIAKTFDDHIQVGQLCSVDQLEDLDINSRICR